MLFVTHYNLDVSGGVEGWIKDVAISLQGRGHKTTVLDTHSGNYNNNLRSQLRAAGVHSITVNTVLGFPRIKDLRTILEKVESADIVYIVYLNRGLLFFVALAVRCKRKVKLIVGDHSDVYAIKPGFVATASRKLLTLLFRGNSKRLLFHSVNSETCSLYRRMGISRVYHFPNGIDVTKYHPSKKFDVFTMLFMAKLVRHKGVHLLGDLANSLAETSEIRLIIAGTGPLKQFVNELCARYPGKISYMGFVMGSEKMMLLSKSHVTLILSKREAFSITGLESLASGTPVVSLDVQGPREYVISGFNGYLCSELAEIVYRVKELSSQYKSSRGEYERISKNAFSTAGRFSLTNVVTSFECMIESFFA